jgi:hypothetical protein
MNIEDLIDNVKSGDAQSSNNTFNSIMADKINAALDIEKQLIASKMYGSEEEPETEIDTDADV